MIKTIKISVFLLIVMIFYTIFTGLPVFCNDISIKPLVSGDVSRLAKDLNNLVSFRQAGPSEPTGLLGFELKPLVNFVDSDNDLVWNNALTGGAPGNLTAPQLIVTKGLPFKADLSARAGKILDTDMEFMGGFLKYSILEGSMLTPALSIGGGYTKITGASDFDASLYEAQISLSKGIANFTPYAGVSWSRLKLTPAASTGHSEVEDDQVRSFAGFRFSFLPMAWMNLEYGKGDSSSLAASFSIGF